MIWETNMETDPATGDTVVVLQYREADAHAFKLTLEDVDEFVERLRLSQSKAGY